MRSSPTASSIRGRRPLRFITQHRKGLVLGNQP
jgi:hypothetical protein